MQVFKVVKGEIPKRHSAPRKKIRDTYVKMDVGSYFEIESADVARGTLYRMAQAARIKVAVSAIRNGAKQIIMFRVLRIE
jgi:hypothetical protein